MVFTHSWSSWAPLREAFSRCATLWPSKGFALRLKSLKNRRSSA